MSGIVCPACGGKAETFDSRPREEGKMQWRRKKCLSCKIRFTTMEYLHGGAEEFERRKSTPELLARASYILKVIQKRLEAKEEDIEKTIRRLIDTYGGV